MIHMLSTFVKRKILKKKEVTGDIKLDGFYRHNCTTNTNYFDQLGDTGTKVHSSFLADEM